MNSKSIITKLHKHIGIDEFKGNCNGTKYQFHIFDLDSHKTVDLYNPFKNIIKAKFINAKIVADRFHYTRIILNALD